MTTAVVSLCHIFIAATRSPTRTGLTRRSEQGQIARYDLSAHIPSRRQMMTK
ncbi:MAG: hypothetical protein K9M08_06130 [Pirellula sp.]|nr:hypothetical protein [Pirellula sp.]